VTIETHALNLFSISETATICGIFYHWHVIFQWHCDENVLVSDTAVLVRLKSLSEQICLTSRSLVMVDFKSKIGKYTD